MQVRIQTLVLSLVYVVHYVYLYIHVCCPIVVVCSKPSANEPHREKAGLRVSDQVRHKPGDTTTEDCRRLEISDLGSGVVLSVLRKRAHISFGYRKADLRLCFRIYMR